MSAAIMTTKEIDRIRKMAEIPCVKFGTPLVLLLADTSDELRAELADAREKEAQARRELEDERDRVNVQREEIRTLRAQLAASSAPVAGEVPEINADTLWEIMRNSPEVDILATSVSAWFRERIKHVDLSRILKDGERAVPTDRIEVLERIATIVAIATGEGSSRARHWPELAYLVVQLEDMRALRHGEAEGGMG